MLPENNFDFKTLRKNAGFTLRKVEELTGISNAYLSQLETGKIDNPSYDKVKVLVNLYGKDVKTPLTINDVFNMGFKPHEGNAFENINNPYFVKNGVCLFYNEGQHNEKAFLPGYGFIYDGKYYAATFKWISDLQSLLAIYQAITLEPLLDA